MSELLIGKIYTRPQCPHARESNQHTILNGQRPSVRLENFTHIDLVVVPLCAHPIQISISQLLPLENIFCIVFVHKMSKCHKFQSSNPHKTHYASRNREIFGHKLCPFIYLGPSVYVPSHFSLSHTAKMFQSLFTLTHDASKKNLNCFLFN